MNQKLIWLLLFVHFLFLPGDAQNPPTTKEDGDAWMIKAHLVDDEEDNGSLRERPIVPKSITIPKLSNNNEKQALPVLSEPRTHTVNIADGFKNENREFKQQKSHIASFADRKNQNAEPAKHVSDNIHKQKDKIKHLRQDISMISPTDGMADTGVGRAYGDPDAYETVGDGIYMMNEGEDEVKPDKMIPLASFSKPKPEKPTNRVGTVKGMKNSVSTNLKKILNKLNKQDKKFARAGNQFEKDEANALSSDETDENPVQNDVEAITPDELASIRRLENKLKAEDRQVDKVSMRKEKDDNAYGVRTDLQIKKQNKHDIQTIISRLVGEDRAFIKHNPYVVDRNNLLKKLKHIRYKDVPALKRTFPEDADSWHIKNVYNSLLKEDEEIVKNMNSPSDKKLKKFISKSAHDDDDWKIKEFLKFAENEDKEISKEKNKKLKLRDSTKAKKKNNTDVLVTNPSFAVMGSQFTSDGMPKFGNVDIEDYLYKSRPEKGDKMNMKLLKKADLHNKVSKKNSTEGAGEDRTDTFSVKENSKTVDFKSSSAKDKSKNHTNLFQSGSIMSNQTSVANCTSLNRSHNATMNQGQKRNFPTSKVPVTSNSSDFRPLKAISQQKVKFHSRNALKRNRYLKHRRHHHYKNATNEGDLNNILIRDLKRVLKKDLRSKTGKVIVTLVTDDKETTIRTDEDSNKKDKRWKATAKPSERQFLSEPDREMDHFSHMTNIVPFTVHENDAGGVEKQIFGNENFIASSVISEKGKNDIASTSFFAPTKPHAMLEDNEGEDFRPQSPSEAPPEIVQSAVKEADSKDLQDIKGVVDGDMQTTMAVFDPKSAQNKVVAFQNGLKSIDEDLFQQDHSTRENERINSFSKDSDNSKEPNNFKIVLHLPKNYNGGPEDIHGIDSNNPIGSVEQIVDKEANGGQENINVQSFSKKLEEDEEDALGKILRQPTPPPSSTAAMSTEHANENKEQNHAEQGSNEDEREQAVDVMAANGKKPENNILNLIKQNEVSLEQKLEGKSDDDVIGDLVKGYKEKNENSDKGIEANNHMSSEANSPGSFANTDQTNYNKEDESSLLSNDIFSGPSNVNPSKPKLAGSSNSKIMQPSMQFSSIKPPHPSFVQSQPAPAKPVPEVDVSKLLDQLQNPRKPDRIKVAQYTPSSINSQAQSPPSNTNTVAQQTPSDNNSPSPNKPKVNPVAQNTPSGNTSSQDQPSTVTNAAAPFAPGNMKIRIKGGQIHGGLIRGGTITGGILNGGDIEGGSILGGRVDGGKFMSGVMENGLIINGTIEGGRIKGGVIEGGSLKSGSVEGGHLKGGSVEGGALKGGEMYGGSLKSGEIDGGFLRNGSVEGGILKGGSIEGGHLLGGLMLGGHLKGGIVKSGVIKGGIIEGGVVEGGVIDDGVVIKGGKVVGASISPQYKMTATYQPQQNVHVSNYQSSNNNNEVLSPSSNQQNARQQDDSNSNEINAQQEPPSDNNILGVPESWPLKNKAHPKPDQDHKQGPGHGKEPCISNSCSFPTNNKQNRPVLLETKPGLGTSSLPKQSGSSKALQNFLKDLEKVDPDLGKPVISDNKKSHFSYKDITKKPTKTVISFKRTTDRNGVSDKKTEMPKGVNTKDITDNDHKKEQLPQPRYHWSLNSAYAGRIPGNPGNPMAVLGDVDIRKGVATLNGKGFLDAGDFQGECLSDPDVCQDGLTISMTNKIYKDSVASRDRMYIFDSGAASPDSRGIALWVNRGKIEASVASQKRTWCLGEELSPFVERWNDLVLSWNRDKGLDLYINCQLLASSASSNTGNRCDVCPDCHKVDKNTHFMFARPNKGPHFKLAHFKSGDISVYDRYFDKDEIQKLCGSNNDNAKPIAMPMQIKKFMPQVLAGNRLTIPAEYLSGYLRPPQDLIQAEPDVSDAPVWPTPPGFGHLLHETSDIVGDTTTKPSHVRGKVLKKGNKGKVNGGYSQWTSWSPCDRSCGYGTQMAVRYCNNPVPRKGGKYCSHLGSARRTRVCSIRPCSKGINRANKPTSSKRAWQHMIQMTLDKRKMIVHNGIPHDRQEDDIDMLASLGKALFQKACH